jgi:hypothetical protein
MWISCKTELIKVEKKHISSADIEKLVSDSTGSTNVSTAFKTAPPIHNRAQSMDQVLDLVQSLSDRLHSLSSAAETIIAADLNLSPSKIVTRSTSSSSPSKSVVAGDGSSSASNTPVKLSSSVHDLDLTPGGVHLQSRLTPSRLEPNRTASPSSKFKAKKVLDFFALHTREELRIEDGAHAHGTFQRESNRKTPDDCEFNSASSRQHVSSVPSRGLLALPHSAISGSVISDNANDENNVHLHEYEKNERAEIMSHTSRRIAEVADGHAPWMNFSASIPPPIDQRPKLTASKASCTSFSIVNNPS